MRVALTALVVLLALAVGILHFSLDFVLFRGNVLGRLGPPPGTPAGSGPPPLPAFPFGLGLNQVFFANLVVFVVLAALLLVALRVRPRLAPVVDVLIVLATLYTLYGWNNLRQPNPMGLGTVAVILEVALVIVTAAHAVSVSRR